LQGKPDVWRLSQKGASRTERAGEEYSWDADRAAREKRYRSRNAHITGDLDSKRKEPGEKKLLRKRRKEGLRKEGNDSGEFPKASYDSNE